MKTKTLMLLSLLFPLGLQAQVKVNVDVQHPLHDVSPMLYGIFYEDINHAADGGLYAELVSNRSFEDNSAAPVHWSAIGQGAAKASLRLVNKKLLNSSQHQALEVTFNGKAGQPSGFANEGYWGINSQRGRTYRLSFWAKGKLRTPLRVSLTDANGQQVYATTTVSGQLKSNWQKFEAEFTANANDPKARLQITTEGKGTVCFDVVSLMPPTFRGHANGLRPDLAGMLEALHPKFVRFPGGCFVEGQGTPENAFRWQRTIGPIENRPGHNNVNWGYRTSDGLGFDEYLQLAEDIGAKPLYVVNVGLWHGGYTPIDSIQPWIDECMAALEYANGPVTSKYGAMRAKNGHPAPYNIEYLEIGNENNQPDPALQSDHYYDRFKAFKKAVLAKYPNMHLIGNVQAWGNDDPKWESTEDVELVDEHYYRNPAWFANNFHKYDSYDRKGPKVYVGEYAVTQGFGNHGSLNAALGEAVYMMGMENNSDVVVMASYAPIFANVNDLKWRPDMIQFNANGAFGTPSYYVQKLMAHNVGDKVLKTELVNPYKIEVQKKKVRPQICQVGVGSWSTQASFQNEALEAANNATQGKLSESEPLTGNWQVKGNTLSQTSNYEGCIDITSQKFDADEYTYKVRARKDGGSEGFIIVFNYVDANNYCWLNVGGWGNTQHAIEQVSNGAKGAIATCSGHVETGRWYDVAVHVKGDSIYASLDGKQILATALQTNVKPGLFQSATLDNAAGEVIVKLVNTSNEKTTASINLGNKKATKARVIRLSSVSGDDENSLETPTNVYPTEQTLSPNDNEVEVTVPATSLNIVRIKL
ncbi:MAG: alpha-L-arabinofuranosidase C-terminal domain-containing protein [Prevotella sp.]|jgi:alpha-L-arabinofuranosidase